MQNYELTLKSQPSNTFRCQKAANSLDIDVSKKLTHEFKVKADLESPYQLGLIVGASGSGKTTFAKKVFSENCFKTLLDDSRPVIDQFPEQYSYDECAEFLSGIGLTSVPCWIRPAGTLSNGQKTRAECALQMASDNEFIVLDEWTSVVDRAVARVMSHCVQKYARKHNKKIVLLSCHYDVIDYLNPDWIIDCNKQEYIDRRSLWHIFKNPERLKFDIREVSKESWKYFSKYHYLSDKLACGVQVFYGLFHGDNQIGFQAFSNYTPWQDKSKKMILHSNRTVIHPDYAGFGLGVKLINETSKILCDKYKIMAKFSSVPIYKSFLKYPFWRLIKIDRAVDGTKRANSMKNSKSGTKASFRTNVKAYIFKFDPKLLPQTNQAAQQLEKV